MRILKILAAFAKKCLVAIVRHLLVELALDAIRDYFDGSGQ